MLYHGTSQKYLENILRDGLTLQGQSLNRQFNIHEVYDFDGCSTHSMNGIYLTTDKKIAENYAFQSSDNTKTRPVILEINIPKDDLVIDEDYINIHGELKDFLSSCRMSTDNDGWFQLKNMLLDEDTRDEMLSFLSEFMSLTYMAKIIPEDMEKLTIAYINRMAAYCMGNDMALAYLTEESKQDIPDIIGAEKQTNIMDAYEENFMMVYDEFIQKYSKEIMKSKRNIKTYRSVQDIHPNQIKETDYNIVLDVSSLPIQITPLRPFHISGHALRDYNLYGVSNHTQNIIISDGSNLIGILTYETGYKLAKPINLFVADDFKGCGYEDILTNEFNNHCKDNNLTPAYPSYQNASERSVTPSRSI